MRQGPRGPQHQISSHGMCSRQQAAAVTCGGDDGRSPSANSPLAARCWSGPPSHCSAGWLCACWQSRSHHRDTRSPARLQQGTQCGFIVSCAALRCSTYLQRALAYLCQGKAAKRSQEGPGDAKLHTKGSGKPLLYFSQPFCRQRPQGDEGEDSPCLTSHAANQAEVEDQWHAQSYRSSKVSCGVPGGCLLVTAHL